MLFEEPQKILIIELENCKRGILAHADFLRYLLRSLKYIKEDLNKSLAVIAKSFECCPHQKYKSDEQFLAIYSKSPVSMKMTKLSKVYIMEYVVVKRSLDIPSKNNSNRIANLIFEQQMIIHQNYLNKEPLYHSEKFKQYFIYDFARQEIIDYYCTRPTLTVFSDIDNS